MATLGLIPETIHKYPQVSKKENNMKWDVIGLGEVRRKEDQVSQLSKVATCCTTLRPTMDKQV